jgi:hypothetical protein
VEPGPAVDESGRVGAFVQEPVVVPAHEGEVVEIGPAAVGPVDEVVGVDVAGCAPGEGAAGAVAEAQGAALGTVDEPLASSQS